ncbi:MAG: sterol desaturase family protein, partial [Opitutaceae bacterium]|nr:sterol desaturase family protein [Opitutaceae bacterium]
ANLLGRAFISFAVHWLHHHVPWLWRLHRVHHLDPELDVSTTVRFHPLEFLTGAVPGAAMAAVLGLKPSMILLYELLDAGVTVFSHANIRLPARVESLLRRVIVTPGLHRVHHSAHQPETDSNFGAVFPIWDQIFGTYRVNPDGTATEFRLGLDEVRDTRASQLGWLLASPRFGRLSKPVRPHPPESARRPRPPAIALAALAGTAALYGAFPALRQPLWPPLGAWAGLPFALGLTLMLWAWDVFRRNRTAVCPGRPTRHLVTDGPYRITRNPMYLGLLLMLAAPLAATCAPIWAAAPAGFFAWTRFVQIPREEAALRTAFGATFEDYVRRVRRWF